MSSLSGAHRFEAVFATGRRTRCGGITVIVAEGVPDQIRVGLVAGRRVGGAVVRNRAKRRLRSALAEVDLVPGRDYVVIATAAVASAPYRTLVRWVRDATKEKERT